jgi:hypothetical protein
MEDVWRGRPSSQQMYGRAQQSALVGNGKTIQLLYLSSAAHPLSTGELVPLLQSLEGEERTVGQLYEKIRQNP